MRSGSDVGDEEQAAGGRLDLSGAKTCRGADGALPRAIAGQAAYSSTCRPSVSP